MNTIADSSDPSAKVVTLANRYARASAAHKKAVVRVAVAKAQLDTATKTEAQAAEESERARKEFAELVMSLA